MDRTTPSTNVCPACGTSFTCGMAAGEASCWCASLPPLLAVPDARTEAACYCPACLTRLLAEQAPPTRP